MISFFLTLQTYKLLYIIRGELILSLCTAGFSFLLSVYTYDCFFLDMAVCGLVLSPSRNRENEQSNSYTLNSIGGGHESYLPYRK